MAREGAECLTVCMYGVEAVIRDHSVDIRSLRGFRRIRLSDIFLRRRRDWSPAGADGLAGSSPC